MKQELCGGKEWEKKVGSTPDSQLGVGLGLMGAKPLETWGGMRSW